MPSLDASFRELQLEPVHGPLRAIFSDGAVRAVLDGDAGPDQVEALERRFEAFLAAVAEATAVSGQPAVVANAARDRLTRTLADPGLTDGLDRRDRAALVVWLALSEMGELAPGSDVAATSRPGTTNFGCPARWPPGCTKPASARPTGWAVTDTVRMLLALPRPSRLGGPARQADARLMEAWLAVDPVRAAIGLNSWQGVEYLDHDGFQATLRWAVSLDAIDGRPGPATKRRGGDLVARLSGAAETAEYRVDRLLETLAPTAAAKRTPRPQEPGS